MKFYPSLSGFVLFTLILLIPIPIIKYEFPVYRVVLDPGHGGINKTPYSLYGDRYDTISEKYLDKFKEGARFQGIYERDIVYSIAQKTNHLLSLCAPDGDYSRFHAILKKYTAAQPSRIYIITVMSRKQNDQIQDQKNSKDPNAAYRLFDYPDKKGEYHQGRISRINAFKPHLVVSLHLAAESMPEYQAMNAVIAAPYDILYSGLLYLSKREKDSSFFRNSAYRSWFVESPEKSAFNWFLNDVSIYFTGYRLEPDKNGNSLFLGYRHNMINWNYRDNFAWESAARFHFRRSKYSGDCKDFIPEGRYWNRERNIYEKFRRDGGEEGFGGDNLYAANEIIRYISASLLLNKKNPGNISPGRPYISVYILPIMVNAISAYIELGYLKRVKDRVLMTQFQDELAEGIAVGVYSLFSGLNIKPLPIKMPPKGKSIDLKKYQIDDKKSYFTAVSD